MTDDASLTIGQVAQRAGLNTSRIRFYERTGVLPQPERVSGQRRYRPDVLHRLSIIDGAQRAGLTLDEIAPLTGPDTARSTPLPISAPWRTTSSRTSTL